ncbi:bifunctional 2-polyprenyl-6-hydroxyphenol methylase/3-demethylubiquinol 3-O-methyltransferase UbiG [Commensalibacter papalotli (ex Botero et al. 2024)]|uniref:Ubiquinone/menaquinone biosynthesis C-methylase UbiE/MenG (UbiE) (PDB:4OBW) n=1 Tax=Commensalibacter papalotli (ex Botero et al. 2024) TaxID=2972766 RepID=A0ABM9HQH3_9PROT|nr:class I SAM-dependent methyltransferase [Commensalibacter papalotli (ex Botero et al. 2024)]CAI3944958.1 Ubiquinone/menaquinone biosynthesis C-methylase UbiE/MenG (UbiE) (PDB:4OBW) [Commensalibacter papalotli (ex Botero et al. 2024)]CAI3945903.1 Ubiquinone/menaquinone biosynthesis C-methylase UbiE/MenG (UbiE) (PDB:4OBW) [Commensalibacter papalotli (ex Botero et al. 2024)]
MTTEHDQQDISLAQQYEAYPYPERNPLDEKKRLFIGSPSHLNEIDYWVFGGYRKATDPLKILVAGCGTGDAAIMMAQQISRQNCAGEVVCLDRAEAVLNIVKERAKVRELTNLRFVQGSIFDLPSLDLGKFDYIDCCGVLHHLPDPDKALRILKGTLNIGGGIGLMVYAPHGRTGVYMLQDALSYLAPIQEKPAQRLEMAKRIMRHLPQTAWLRANQNFGDHLTGGDAGLYDLLLNPRDRAYTVDALWDLIQQTGFEINAFIEPARYDPKYLITDPKFRERVEQLDLRTQAVVAEGLVGNMATHVVYIRRSEDELSFVDPLDLESIPFMREMPGDILANQILPSNLLPFSFGTLTVMIPLPAQARGFLGLIDGKRSLGEIIEVVRARGVPEKKILPLWQETFEKLRSINQLFVRVSE